MPPSATLRSRRNVPAYSRYRSLVSMRGALDFGSVRCRAFQSMTTHERRDITIIGGGPTGIFATFYAGMRGATAQIVDALPELGGQLTALYPEKYIFDVAGFAQVLAKDLVKALAEQAARWGFPTHLNQRVVGLEQDGDQFVLVTETDRFPSRAIVIAAGIGA